MSQRQLVDDHPKLETYSKYNRERMPLFEEVRQNIKIIELFRQYPQLETLAKYSAKCIYSQILVN